MLHELDDQQRQRRNVMKSTARRARRRRRSRQPLADAWALGAAAPAGPAWVEIPQDVLLDADARAAGASRRWTSIPQRLAARPNSIDEAAALLLAAPSAR